MPLLASAVHEIRMKILCSNLDTFSVRNNHLAYSKASLRAASRGQALHRFRTRASKSVRNNISRNLAPRGWLVAQTGTFQESCKFYFYLWVHRTVNPGIVQFRHCKMILLFSLYMCMIFFTSSPPYREPTSTLQQTGTILWCKGKQQ